MISAKGTWVAAVALAALTSCALGPQREPAVSYDLGPPGSGAAPPAIPALLLVPEVSAPAWLDSSGIVYRLSYDNSARPQAYAASRWVAPPPALLTHRLRSRLAGTGGILTGSDGVRADYALRVELEDFSQSFSSPTASRVTLRARTSLVRLADRALIAQEVFTVGKDAPSADARGAVAGLGQASDEFIETLARWTAEQVGRRAGK
jgi:cholesterol transport system auxiliary component